ncbi:hypothetical protein HYS97_01205 [Candidatus Daviesbacteria bacterium]|nr:hypothetical protein [Candidatus Daviesbacteria bacterium]
MLTNIFDLSFLISNGLSLVFKVGFVAFALLYFIFSLIVIRQVNIMTEAVATEGAPVLKALAIIHTGLALGVLILFIGFF